MSMVVMTRGRLHFDYPAIDDTCDCLLCVDWRAKRAVYAQLLSVVDNHPRSCMCGDCAAMRRVRTSYHAAVNKRDLWSEMTYLANGKAWGEFVLSWLGSEINDPKRGDGWWEGRAPYYSLGYWLNRAHHCRVISSRSMVVSGAAA
jgi:hypothetical protein